MDSMTRSSPLWTDFTRPTSGMWNRRRLTTASCCPVAAVAWRARTAATQALRRLAAAGSLCGVVRPRRSTAHDEPGGTSVTTHGAHP
jgi:hypothetical protein